MAIKQIWFVYKTTNLLNGRFYIGVHKGTVCDSYLGSGIALKRAVKLHGKDNFEREVVLVCESLDDAYELEALIVDQDFVARSDVYNIALGGRGSNDHPHSEETKQRMRKPKSVEHRKAISESKFGRTTSDKHKVAVSLGKTGTSHSEQTKAKMSGTRSGKVYPRIKCPHCGKTGGAPAMKQWHFNNCKHRRE